METGNKIEQTNLALGWALIYFIKKNITFYFLLENLAKTEKTEFLRFVAVRNIIIFHYFRIWNYVIFQTSLHESQPIYFDNIISSWIRNEIIKETGNE